MKAKRTGKKKFGTLAKQFLTELCFTRRKVIATNRNGLILTLQDGLGKALNLMVGQCAQGNQIFFIGNGGSAAIASHQSVDYWKLGGLKAVAFNDASLLTCMGNDMGFENVFAVPIKHFARPGDILIAISSSGKSQDIINGAGAGHKAGCRVITFSGFGKANPLRSRGELNFYVPAHSYGIVEVTHLSLLHAMLDARIKAGFPSIRKKL